MCASVYLVIPCCTRLLLGVISALSFKPFMRRILPSLEIDLWSTRLSGSTWTGTRAFSGHLPLIPPSL